MMAAMDNMTSQAGQPSGWPWEPLTELVPDLTEVPATDLAVTAAPLSESDRARLTEYWSRVIAEVGADLADRKGPAHPSRRARRVARQRADQLVRVLPSAVAA